MKKYLLLSYQRLIGCAVIILLLSGCFFVGSPKLNRVSISGDGTLLAVSYKLRGEPMKIAVVDLTTETKLDTIEMSDGTYADGPIFSNDGSRIAFTSGTQGEFANEILIYDIASRRISEVAKSDLPMGLLSFSPTDAKIAFARAGRIRPSNAASPIGDVDVFTVNTNTKVVERITVSKFLSLSSISYVSEDELLIVAAPLGATGADAGFLSTTKKEMEPLDLGVRVAGAIFLRENKEIIYVAHANVDEYAAFDYELFSFDGSERKQLTNRKAYIESFDASSSGEIVAYLMDVERDRDYRLVVDNLVENTSRRLDQLILDDLQNPGTATD